MPVQQTIKPALLLFAVLAALLIAACNSSAPPHNSAAGAGEAVFRQQCLTCHETDMVEQQRLSKSAWTREVDKMTRWGAVVKEEEKEPLIEYLSAHYGPRPLHAAVQPAETPDAASVARGKAVFAAKCLECHETDMVEQQRLSKSAWTREVDKMTRWGAPVTEEEKGPLVDYLFADSRTRLMAK